jgi:F-type H+-transporting ATPase subunit gamma
MAKTRAIVKRLKAIRNIRKIMRTMELIATARFKKAMDRAVQAEAYTTKLAELVRDLSHSTAGAKHPLLEPRETVKRSLLLVVASNRGYCGGYNANVLRAGNKSYQDQSTDHEVELEVSGKRAVTFFRYRKISPARAHLHFEDKPTFDQVEQLADRYIEAFLQGRIDRLDVAYTQFISIGRQAARVATLLPLGAIEAPTAVASRHEAVAPVPAAIDYEFLPGANEILNEIVPVSFKIRLFKCFLDAAVSEQIARMVAMKGATENAGNLIRTLTMRYNRARQSQITSELAEIIGTAEALK